VRSHVARDYAFTWLPWPADDPGQRFVKMDFDSGGGQLEVAWRVWTAAERRELILHNDLGAANVYHRTFPQPPRSYGQSYPPTVWNTLGFKSYRGATHSSLGFPYWSAALLAVAPWAIRLDRRARRRRLERAGRCPACGYDLRASPGRCPECGRRGELAAAPSAG
jgi:hypothetical protein